MPLGRPTAPAHACAFASTNEPAICTWLNCAVYGPLPGVQVLMATVPVTTAATAPPGSVLAEAIPPNPPIASTVAAIPVTASRRFFMQTLPTFVTAQRRHPVRAT